MKKGHYCKNSLLEFLKNKIGIGGYWKKTNNLNIGTCSWKYDSWQGIIYPGRKPFNYLQEYSRQVFRFIQDQLVLIASWLRLDRYLRPAAAQLIFLFPRAIASSSETTSV
jgi:hypothetical protein